MWGLGLTFQNALIFLVSIDTHNPLRCDIPNWICYGQMRRPEYFRQGPIRYAGNKVEAQASTLFPWYNAKPPHQTTSESLYSSDGAVLLLDRAAFRSETVCSIASEKKCRFDRQKCDWICQIGSLVLPVLESQSRSHSIRSRTNLKFQIQDGRQSELARFGQIRNCFF